jgi:hypothetical protein
MGPNENNGQEKSCDKRINSSIIESKIKGCSSENQSSLCLRYWRIVESKVWEAFLG